MKVFFVLLAFTIQARAACPTFSDLKMNVEICEDNFILGKKADSCLDQITKEISGIKPIVEKAMEKSAQNNSMQEASSVYSKALTELNRLILLGEASKAAVDSYMAQIYMPEDSDKPSLIGMSTEQYLKKEPCYATPHKVMKEDSDMLQILVLDLKQKKAAIEAARTATNAHQKNLNNGSAQPLIQGSQKSPAPKATNPNAAKSPGSSISGTITDGKSKKVQEQEQK